MEELLTVADVCRQLRVSRTRLYERIANGSIPRPFHLAPRCPRWRRETIERWIAARERDAA